jgi:single-strand DNA-binding protein
MRGINRVTLLGKLGLDPDLQHTGSGVPVCNLRVATNEMYTDSSGERRSAVEWHNVTVWGQRGVAASKKLCTGCTVMIEGRLESHKYTTKAGMEARSWNVVAKNIIFLTTEDEFEYEDE